jgi:hypothetical protein
MLGLVRESGGAAGGVAAFVLGRDAEQWMALIAPTRRTPGARPRNRQGVFVTEPP